MNNDGFLSYMDFICQQKGKIKKNKFIKRNHFYKKRKKCQTSIKSQLSDTSEQLT